MTGDQWLAFIFILWLWSTGWFALGFLTGRHHRPFRCLEHQRRFWRRASWWTHIKTEHVSQRP